jgi:hypothetical protein
MSYTTAAKVKKLSYLIADLVIAGILTDQQILDVSDTFSIPELDAALYGYGAPFTVAPSIVVLMDTLLTGAYIFEDRLSHRDEAGGWAKAKRDAVVTLIERVRNGELISSGLTAQALLVMSDPTADRPATEYFTGDDIDWGRIPEVRED